MSIATNRDHVAAPDGGGWMSGLAARKRLGVSMHGLWKFVASGEVHTQNLPGTATKFAADDIERLAVRRAAGGQR